MRTREAERALLLRQEVDELEEEIRDLIAEKDEKLEGLMDIELSPMEEAWVIEQQRHDGELHIIACEMEEGR